MQFKKGEIDGVLVKPLKKNVDERGFLIETFRIDEFADNIKPVMSYVSFTRPGIARGPHEHVHQTDIFSFIGPGTFLVKLWDNRKNSKTFGHLMEIKTGHENACTIIIPPGVIHGYKNISKEDGMVLNFPDKLYRGPGKNEEVDEIRHEDKKDSPFTF
ncbi:MAG: dTDP-4-dehydrorhamnose 3,5-epimerase family protein [Spirochaetes bacterium]|nr:dTDP-4-dehydrorhamnose 3,5-epimerase family protein [Spirochaetota bacterium]